jgi:hypothetical protein
MSDVNKAHVAGRVVDATYFAPDTGKMAFLRFALAYDSFTTASGVRELQVKARLYGELAETWQEAIVEGEWIGLNGHLAVSKDTHADNSVGYSLYVTTDSADGVQQVDEGTFANEVDFTGSVLGDAYYFTKYRDDAGEVDAKHPTMKPLVRAEVGGHKVSVPVVLIDQTATENRDKLGAGAVLAVTGAQLVNRQVDDGVWEQQLVRAKSVKVVTAVARAKKEDTAAAKPAAGGKAKPTAKGKPAPRS